MPAKAASATQLRDPEPTVWKIGGAELVQDKLTFFEKNEFLGIVARAMDSTLEQGGVSGLMSALSLNDETIRGLARGEMDLGSIPDATNVMSLILKLIGSAPTLLEDAYMVALSIDPRDRGRFRLHMREHMDDETGFGIFETFVVQNEKTLRAFLPQWIARFKTAMETLYPKDSEGESDASPTSSD